MNYLLPGEKLENFQKIFPELTPNQSEVLVYWAMGGNISTLSQVQGKDKSNTKRTLLRSIEKLHVSVKQARSLVLIRILHL